MACLKKAEPQDSRRSATHIILARSAYSTVRALRSAVQSDDAVRLPFSQLKGVTPVHSLFPVLIVCLLEKNQLLKHGPARAPSSVKHRLA